MITLNENAVQINDIDVTIGEWFQIDENNDSTKRFTPNTIVMDRAEAIELAKAILASVDNE